MGDVKAYLRKLDFPDVVNETLGHMQKLWLPDGSTQQLSLLKELSQEFVFFETDQWGSVREPKLTAIKVLQVLDKIATFFEGEEKPDSRLSTSPCSRLATFIFLFPYGSPIFEKRLPILSKLVSLALAVGNYNLLNYIAIWMQLNGCASENSLYLAKNVRLEYFRPNLPVSPIIEEWVQNASPLFCASLTIALANLYVTENPPKHVIEVILNWTKTNPSFCFEPLKMRVPGVFNFSGPQTPCLNIMRWVVLAPFYKTEEQTDSLKKFFSSVTLALLEAMVKEAPKVKEVSVWEAIPVEAVQKLVKDLKSTPLPSPEAMSVCLARFAQCLEIGLSYRCIHRSEKLADLFLMCIGLPFHQLLKIVLQKWSHELESRVSVGSTEKISM